MRALQQGGADPHLASGAPSGLPGAGRLARAAPVAAPTPVTGIHAAGGAALQSYSASSSRIRST